MRGNRAGTGTPAPVRVVVLGGGTAGWMTAAALVTHLPQLASVTLVESPEIGIVGVGEATLPHIRDFVTQLGLDEAAFMAATDATFKLGIAFDGFGAPGERYIHPFGSYGRPLSGVGFHHYWLRARAGGDAAPFSDYALGVVAAEACRFARPTSAGQDLAASYGYAYQFDATKFAPYLRDVATARGAARVEATVADIERGPAGELAALRLGDGGRVEGDFFIDCSGFRSLLLGGAMNAGWEDWSRWLPCDRAVAAPCAAAAGPIAPYTTATAMEAGWRWRIPLTTRVGNGYVYASAMLDDATASEALLAALEGPALAELRVLRFRAGRRRQSWVGNVVGIGLASGFLEPLESTSIYLVQMAIARLIELFPLDGARNADRTAFNAQVDMEYDRIRDFLILHYHATRRHGSAFWDHVRTMAVPDSLAEKLALWRGGARVAQYDEGLFLEPSWLAVLIGQGVLPNGHDPRADIPPPADLSRALADLRGAVADAAAAMPVHAPALTRAA